MEISHDKFEFLCQEHGICGSLTRYQMLILKTEGRLATKSAEAADLWLCCADLSIKAALVHN